MLAELKLKRCHIFKYGTDKLPDYINSKIKKIDDKVFLEYNDNKTRLIIGMCIVSWENGLIYAITEEHVNTLFNIISN